MENKAQTLPDMIDLAFMPFAVYMKFIGVYVYTFLEVFSPSRTRITPKDFE